MNIKNNKNCKITINDEGIAVSEKEKTADEMFNKLGFTEIRNEYNYFTYETKGGKNGYIRFDTEEKIVCAYHSIYGGEFIRGVSVQELQAINKKCKELRLDIMNKCKYITIRTKNYEKYFYCRLNKKIINYTAECIKCVKNEPRKNKGINKKTSKQIKLEKSRYSILTDDLEHCYICRFQGKKVLRDDLHEVYEGANRKRSILNGLVVPLCRKHHQNEEILSELKVATQKKYEVNHTRDEFIKLIGKSYIK